MKDKITPDLNVNISVYTNLYYIETAIREMIIDLLSGLDGPLWYKKRLPGDILQKYSDGLKGEKSSKWMQTMPHHPIYYIDFADLKKIIERTDNWHQAFQQIFGRREIIVNTLSEIEPIRNKIAHNRMATDSDLDIVKTACIKISGILGAEKFDEFITRCTHAPDIMERIDRLDDEGTLIYKAIKACQSLADLPNWSYISRQWWFDEVYLGHKLDNIIYYFRLAEEYIKLPRGRGTGYKIEEWVQEHDLLNIYTTAEAEFKAILQFRR